MSHIEIKPAQSPGDFEAAKQLITEYVAWLGYDLSFQNFDQEMEGLPAMYNEHDGGLFIAWLDGKPVGVAGLRRFGENDGEVKRMFVKEDARGLGVGKQLLNTCIETAKKLSYNTIKLDTADFMKPAIKLYTDSGFVEIAAYRFNPHEEARYFELKLSTHKNFSHHTYPSNPIHTTPRIQSVDLLRGVVMVIMAIDHVREHFNYSSFFFDPTDPEKTTLAIFFTRFITHFCAPAFSFLAGLSVFFVGKRKTPAELSGYLFKRGVWLIFMEITIMNFGEDFDFLFRDEVLQVLSSLGMSMILLSGLIHFQKKYILIFSIILIFGHNLLDNIHFEGSILWAAIHERNFFPISADHSFGIGYPMVPWPAVMALGYCFGSMYDSSFDQKKRRTILNQIGIAALVLFILLRVVNVYGNLLPWEHYETALQTFISFININKYPPSLMFLLVTLGGSFLFLANSENLKGRVVDFFSVFGRVPFFFYIVHIYLIHFLALLAAEFTGYGWESMILPFMPERAEALKGYGFNLVTTYLIWIGVIVVMYPLCKMFDGYKQLHREKWWVGYL